jgi:3-oxoadipate CoA-transferase beta subunit
VYTDHAVFDITPDGFAVRETFGATIEELAALTGLTLRPVVERAERDETPEEY